MDDSNASQKEPGVWNVGLVWCRSRQFFSLKGQTVNILGFASHLISITNIKLCCYSWIRLYKNVAGQVWIKDHSLLIPWSEL